MRDIQVLTPVKAGPAGVHALNRELKAALNPRAGDGFQPGDKVMQIENDYDREVYNGDIGVVLAAQPEEGTVTVAVDGRELTYRGGELERLVLAYATTVHKAQGSEYPAVVMPVSLSHRGVLDRNLLYTAVTRGRRLVVLVGDRVALGTAVATLRDRRRWSALAQRLAELPDPGVAADPAAGAPPSGCGPVTCSPRPSQPSPG